MSSNRKYGTFAATTDGNYNVIPYNRASSFRVTNFTGKVVGIRLRANPKVVDDFNDHNFSEWTGDIEYNEMELEGTSAGRVTGSAYRQLTDEVVMDGAEVEISIRTPNAPVYSVKFSVMDHPDRMGMDGAGFVTVTEQNTKSNTNYKITIRLNPTTSEFDAFVAEEGKDRVAFVSEGTGNFGLDQLQDSIVAIETDQDVLVDPIIYHQKVNYSVEHIGHGGTYTYPCEDNTSEYEIINLGSDAMNYSDNTQTISISGFYAR